MEKDSSNSSSTNIILTNIERRSFTIRISNNFFQRFTKHLRLLKRIKVAQTKQNWLEDAIQKKFEVVKNLNLLDDVGDKFVTVKLDKNLAADIENKITELRKLGIKINKKQFFLEAIGDKLAMEEHEVHQKAQELLQKLIPKT